MPRSVEFQVAAAFRPHRRGAGPSPGADRQFVGGLIAQTLAGRGLSAATVAIERAPFGGMLPLPVWTEAPVDAETAERGPLLMISGDRDHTVPPSVTLPPTNGRSAISTLSPSSSDFHDAAARWP